MPSLPPALLRALLAAAVVLASLAAATQWTAALLDHHQALGAPWLDLLGLKVYAPWKLFFWWLAYGAQAPSVFARTGTLAALGGVVSGLVATGGAARRPGHGGTPSTTYGSARWSRSADVRDAGLFSGKGIVLGDRDGRYLRHDGPEHVLAVAPTRSGKGVGLVVPTLMTWAGSAVIHDIKGENWQLTAGWRSQFSHCLLLDPTNPLSARFNPLLEVRKRLSDTLGTSTQLRAQRNLSWGRLSAWLSHIPVSEQETPRPLLTPGEILQLPAGDALVMVSGRPPIRATRLRYYADHNFLARRLATPALVPDRYHDAPPAPADELPSHSSNFLRFPAFPNCLATASGDDVVGRPIAELPPAERLLINRACRYDANKLDEVTVALHARLADLADANGSTNDETHA